MHGGARVRRRDAGHHLDGDAGRTHRRHLFRRTAEHEGVAALEARHALTFERLAHENAIDVVLGGGRPFGLLADVDALSVAPCVFEDDGIDETVDDENVGLLQPLLRPERQQIGIARTAADEGDAARGARPGAGRLELALELALSSGGFTAQYGGAPYPGEQRLPQATPRGCIGEAVLHPAPQRHGALGHSAEVRWQPGFDLGFDLAGENGRSALSADGDHDRIAVDDRRHDEGAFGRAVDHVVRNAQRFRRARDVRVGGCIVVGGKCDHNARKVVGSKAPAR